MKTLIVFHEILLPFCRDIFEKFAMCVCGLFSQWCFCCCSHLLDWLIFIIITVTVVLSPILSRLGYTNLTVVTATVNADNVSTQLINFCVFLVAIVSKIVTFVCMYVRFCTCDVAAFDIKQASLRGITDS